MVANCTPGEERGVGKCWWLIARLEEEERGPIARLTSGRERLIAGL